jgi:tripartite-type tricarboxylate transporter receptor subunit TctC
MLRFLLHLCLSACLGCGAAMAADPWPTRPITVLIGFPPGGVTDAMVRVGADVVRAELGQPLVVENRPGTAGTVALRQLVERPADGHTIGIITSAALINQHMRNAGFNTDHDITPIIMFGQTRIGLIAPPNARWQSMAQLIAEARARPGTIRYSSPGIGSPQHLTMVRLAREAGVSWIHVPYRNGPEALFAVEKGEVDASASASEFIKPAQDGRVRVLAAFGATRMPEFPQVPTATEQGFPLVSFSFFGLVGPRGMDATAVRRLHDAFRKAMDLPAFQAVVAQFGLVRDHRDPQQFGEFMLASNRQFGELVRQANLKSSD